MDMFDGFSTSFMGLAIDGSVASLVSDLSVTLDGDKSLHQILGDSSNVYEGDIRGQLVLKSDVDTKNKDLTLMVNESKEGGHMYILYDLTIDCNDYIAKAIRLVR